MTGARFAVLLKNYGWVLNLVFIAAGSYFVAGAANAVVESKIRIVPTVEGIPQGPTTPSVVMERGPYAKMAERNLLGAKRENLNPQAAGGEGGAAPAEAVATGRNYKEEELKPCTLPISVRGTLISDEAEWSMAIIFDTGKREVAVFTINEGSNELAADAWLVDVRVREVVIRRRTHFERCTAEGETPEVKVPAVAAVAPAGDESPPDGGEGVRKISDSEYEIEGGEIDKALSNLNQVATHARIVPSFKNGKANGFKLFSIKPGSIFARVGLQNGDVIQSINGYEINSPEKALEIYQKLRDATNVNMDILRRGQGKHMNYPIKR